MSFQSSSRKELDAMAPRSKVGSAANQTDASHKLSFEVAKGVLDHASGRPVSAPESVASAASVLNADSNLRIKDRHTNRSDDRLNDQKILDSVTNSTRLDPAAAPRAVQAYKGGISVSGQSTVVDRVTETIGAIPVNTGNPGRPPTVASLAAPSPSDVDRRSSAVKSGEVLLREDGKVDQRSAAVRNGDVKVTKSGEVDGRCRAARSGDIKKK